MTILTPINDKGGNAASANSGLPDEAALNRMASEFFALVPGAAQAAAQFLPGFSQSSTPEAPPSARTPVHDSGTVQSQPSVSESK